MQQYQTRVRRMRKDGRQRGRNTDGIRQTYYDERIRAAKGVTRVTAVPESTKDQEQESTS